MRREVAYEWRLIPSRSRWIDLERRLIQLKIEREAVKKDSDAAAKKRQKETTTRYSGTGEREYADLRANMDG